MSVTNRDIFGGAPASVPAEPGSYGEAQRATVRRGPGRPKAGPVAGGGKAEEAAG